MTTTLPQSPRKKDAQVIPHLSWEQFEEIEKSFESVPGVKFRYLDGALEIMTISPEHEDFKSTIALLIEAYLRVRHIRFYKRGGPTLGERELGARSEPDESYNIGVRKNTPDIVLEVVITSGGVDKLEGYRRMGVAEVWFWEDGIFTIHQLESNGYAESKNSNLLPDLPLNLLSRFVISYDQYDAVEAFTASLNRVEN